MGIFMKIAISSIMEAISFVRKSFNCFPNVALNSKDFGPQTDESVDVPG